MVGRILVIFIFISSWSWAQTDRYFVSFKDKNGTPHNISQPSTFLSVRAQNRRAHSGVSITQTDLPVTPSYVSQIRAAGAKAFFTSRWMNGVLIEASASVIATVNALPFVLKSELVAPGAKLQGGRVRQYKQKFATSATEVTDTQLSMLGIDSLQANGYNGNGILISVLDDGFQGVNTAPPFQSVFSEGRVKMTKDFVTNSGNIYQFDDHGTEVFSIISAQIPGSYSAGAPKSDYLLFVTEDVSTEYRVEEYNWLFAAELSDSAGADVIQSSLGYNMFDNPVMNYVVANLDGKTTVVAKAASFARDRAIIVVVSAGNEGNSSWHYISSPADVDGILATGAVNSSGAKASFSSFGPTADNRIKPDIAALGQNVSVILPNGTIGGASGTSMASPLATCLVAGLLQAYPQLTPAAIVDAVKRSASQSQSPDNSKGYGIPSYMAVRNYLKASSLNGKVLIYPNPTEARLMLAFKELPEGSVQFALYDTQGKLLNNPVGVLNWLNNPLEISVSGLAPGSYLLKIKTASLETTLRFVKL
ncbi:MAG TPA: S8 family serine peptidase [Cyclobacteriaceae bacterium]|nr:S8 family serine peptidase [Cyclobacteriaceae bacterium]